MGDRLEGQRRQVTVLFADMVGYTSISERLGEEATYGLMQAVLEPISRAVHEHGGKVKTYTGDGVMANPNTSSKPEADRQNDLNYKELWRHLSAR